MIFICPFGTESHFKTNSPLYNDIFTENALESELSITGCGA